MTSFTEDQTELVLKQREQLDVRHLNKLWRLQSGALRMDTVTDDAHRNFICLVLPGDWLGTEHFGDVGSPMTVRALATSRLVCMSPGEQADENPVLMATVARCYQRTRELALFRTGAAHERIKQLLKVLSAPGSAELGDEVDCIVPSLSDIADIVHAAPETVSRTLADLRNMGYLRDRSTVQSKHTHLKSRQYRVQVQQVVK
jgi:CRP-like cAMP-binding protein